MRREEYAGKGRGDMEIFVGKMSRLEGKERGELVGRGGEDIGGEGRRRGMDEGN